MNEIFCLLVSKIPFLNFEILWIIFSIFNSHFKFIIIYIDDVLIFFELLEKYFVHLKKIQFNKRKWNEFNSKTETISNKNKIFRPWDLLKNDKIDLKINKICWQIFDEIKYKKQL